MQTCLLELKSIDDTRALLHSLNQMGVRRDKIQLVGASLLLQDCLELPRAELWHETDIIHSSERGGILGASLALATALMLWMLEPWGFSPDWLNLGMMVLLLGGFCAWVGGLIGINHAHYQLGPFWPLVREGQIILRVESANAGQSQIIEQIISRQNGKLLAKHRALDNPLESAPLVELD